MPLLELKNLRRAFYGLEVLRGVDFSVAAGGITGLIGPNGAGKTTLFNVVSGLVPPDGGSIRFDGREIAGAAPDVVSRAGLVRTFQVARGFPKLSVFQHLMLYGRDQPGESLWQAIMGTRAARDREAALAERAWETARFLRLDALIDNPATALSGGQKKLLEIGRALMAEPRLVLLDEPTAGVDPKARRAFWDEIHAYAAQGITVLVSTHYMDEAERCHEIAYIAYGELMARGTALEIIRQSGLIAFIATGPGADRLAVKLRDAPGVTAAAAFGATLHVCGPDREALKQAIEPYGHDPTIVWQEAAPTLEDIFIHLMGTARDNAPGA
ncbi:MAG: ATP-binding cassette domain-containing protein [Reyranella sp.]|nr:ATP-binding cassette domain-containing protein [Reyranella sp.]